MGGRQASLADVRPSGLKPPLGVRRSHVDRIDSRSSRLPSSGGTVRSRSVSEELDFIQHAMIGDPASQDRLFAAQAARLYRTAFAVLRNKEDAEDAVQDGLYSAYTKLRSFQGRSSFSTWLTRIVINSALMTRRRQRLRRQASLDEILDSMEGRLPAGIVDGRPDPEEICSASEITGLVEEEIHRLPVALRTAFQLRNVEGFSSEESSRAIGISTSALKSRLSRARKKLTRYLQRSLRPPVRLVVALVAMPILIAGLLVSVSDARQLQTPTKAVQLTGLIGVKGNTKGSLTIEHGNLRFIHSGSNADLAPSAMQDVVTEMTANVKCYLNQSWYTRRGILMDLATPLKSTNVQVNPAAGKPADPSILVNVPKLVTAYYGLRPDPDDTKQRVVFGTSGHRGSAFDCTFNEWHILAITQAICNYRRRRNINGPLFLGMDTHALSEPAFASALEVLAANNVEVMLSEATPYTPTPTVSHAILRYNHGRKTALADGIVITPSHNPPDDGGFKYDPPHGGPADSDVTSLLRDH